MLLGFKTELKLNKSQRVLLSKHAGTARHAWNWGLALTKQILDNNKAQLKIARLHRKIANIRSDTLHKLTTYISNNHAVIGLEDLNVSGMMGNRKLASSIGDMGFYEFRRQLEYKCQLFGSKLVFVDRFYPSSKTCSNCGQAKESLSLSERVFRCDECGFSCDRDLNASINLAQAASSAVSACGLDNADVFRVKQEEDVSNWRAFLERLRARLDIRR